MSTLSPTAAIDPGDLYVLLRLAIKVAETDHAIRTWVHDLVKVTCARVGALFAPAELAYLATATSHTAT